MKRHHSLLMLVAIASFFTGCSSPNTQQLTAITPGQLGPVSCSLEGRDKPIYLSDKTKAVYSYPLGPLGTAMAIDITAGGGQAILDKMSQATGFFERPQIIGDLETSMKGAGYVVQQNAKAKFAVYITGYGLYKNSTEMAHAYVEGIGTLKDASGKVVWRGEALGLSNVERTVNEFAAKPELYRDNLVIASKGFSGLLIGVVQNGSCRHPIPPM